MKSSKPTEKPEEHIVTLRNKDETKFKFGENEDGSKSEFGEDFIQRCALCNYQMHESQIVCMYNDQAFCCHRCRAKVMALDRLQTYKARTESEDCSKEVIISLSSTEKPEEHNSTSRDEDESKSKFGEKLIRNCALCNCQMHESQIVYMYNDRAFCCHRCRAKVMALDRFQTFAAGTESEDCLKEIISLSNQLS